MAREQWAKVDVDMPTDEKLFGRPLLERHLWTCLICLSKKNFIETGDYTIHNLDASALNSRFNLGSTPGVEKGLKYFETCQPRPIIKRREGSIFLLNIEKRQANQKTGEQPSTWAAQREQRERTNLVYFIRSDATGLIKVGTSKNPWARMATLQREHPELGKLSMVGTLPGSGYDVEFEIHTKFKEHRRTGEWFEAHPELLAIATRKVATATVASGDPLVASKRRPPATAEATRLQQDQDQDLDPKRSSQEIPHHDPGEARNAGGARPSESPWDPELLFGLREYLGKQDTDPDWLSFLAATAKMPRSRDERAAAAKKFMSEGLAAKVDAPLAYLRTMIRDGAGRRSSARGNGEQREQEAGARVVPGREESDRWRQEQRELAERVEKERLERKRKGLPSAAQEALAKARKHSPNGAPKA